MLKSASVLAAAVLAAAGFAGSASAATITPNPTSFTLTGTLTLSQSTTVTCNVSLTGSVPAGGGSATITSGSFSGGSWQCGTLVFPTGFPWGITLNGGTSITVVGIGATSILGSCSGNITTSWVNGSPGKVTFTGATIPGSPNSCTITGTLNSSPSLTVS
ncbi:protein activator of alkane oxidation PraB [Caulobacter hibisci]|uniref:Protein activator of alkane oxidation PraB n=1 Tax=Caulobacter hibisci TaxID=2035993 RepID=A0ABS0SW60_9CAUL|nr:protein activator of alkane oxidation PraB [Caulobacter hibisci]MBI1683646.1 protein activator of alkane oxidation PraB [Caulobacter hibisci]